MATLIKSVSFQNFYNYYGNFDQNCYKFKEGINIVNADNNMGKSKFYNGFLWILNDTVYDSDLKRTTDPESSYLKMASGKAKREESSFKMGVRIVILEDNAEYSITKSIPFNRINGNWTFGTLTLEAIETLNGKTMPIYDVREKDEIIKKIIPKELLSYALLQGESMEKLVDLSSRDGLSSTIEILAGITNIINICSTCDYLTRKSKNLLNSKEKEFSDNEEKVITLSQEKDTIENFKDASKEKIDKYKEELSEAKKKKLELEALQLNATKREKFRGIQESLINKIQDLQKQKNEKEKNVTMMLFSGSGPWLLQSLSNQIGSFSALRDELNIARTKIQISKDPTILLPEGSPDVPSLHRMLKTESCEVCGRKAEKDSEAWKHIEKIMNRPRINSLTSKNDFSLFFGDIQNTVGSFYNSIPEIPDAIVNYRNNLEKIQSSIEQLEKDYEEAKIEFMNAGGRDFSTDKDTISSYSLAEKKEEDCKKLIITTEKYISTLDLRLKQIEGELINTSGSEKVHEYRKFRDTLAYVEQMFTNTKERIYDEIIQSLEENANQKYSDLTHGNFTSGGKLCFLKQEDNTVQVSIKDVLNGEMTGLGTGFQRMKQLSIIMAIISSKFGNHQFNYPFISDAPFSEFGENFINNFFAVAPKVFTQSIILIKELYDPNDKDFLNHLGKKILQEMMYGNIQGTFYVNIVEEDSDTSNLVTTNKCYKS